MDSSEEACPQAQLCEQGIREQVEILYRYKERVEHLDPLFVSSHARTIVQLSDEMAVRIAISNSKREHLR